MFNAQQTAQNDMHAYRTLPLFICSVLKQNYQHTSAEGISHEPPQIRIYIYLQKESLTSHFKSGFIYIFIYICRRNLSRATSNQDLYISLYISAEGISHEPLQIRIYIYLYISAEGISHEPLQIRIYIYLYIYLQKESLMSHLKSEFIYIYCS